MHRTGLVVLLVLFVFTLNVSADEPATSRTFLLTYQATVTGLQPGQTIRIWLPVPPSNDDQDAKLTEQQVSANGRETREPIHGNTIFYAEEKAPEGGTITLSRTYRITRRLVIEDKKTRLTREEIELYLKPNAKVPIDGKPLTLLAEKTLPDEPHKLGKALFDVVNGHMRYSKEGTGWGRGDAVWACESKYGNCSDFHSLFLSLARAKRLPAKFEIGFPLPEKRGRGEITGYHCWAKFSPDGKGWVPVDISEANKDPRHKDSYFGRLTPDRVLFSVGRDLTLEPKQDGPPLNFFIYPHVEVDGKPIPAEKIQTKVVYEDLPPDR